MTRHTKPHTQSTLRAPALPAPGSKLPLALPNPPDTLIFHGCYFKRCFRVTLEFAHTINPNRHLQAVKQRRDARAVASHKPPSLFSRGRIWSPFSTNNARPLLPTSIPKTGAKAGSKCCLDSGDRAEGPRREEKGS